MTSDAERRLVTKLMLHFATPFDPEATVLDWVNAVNGKTIFPKLAVYLITWDVPARVKCNVRTLHGYSLS